MKIWSAASKFVEKYNNSHLELRSIMTDLCVDIFYYYNSFLYHMLTNYKIKLEECLCLLVSKPFPFWWGWWCCRIGITRSGWWWYLWWRWWQCWGCLETIATDPHLWAHPLLDQPVQQVPVPLLADHHSIPWRVHDIFGWGIVRCGNVLFCVLLSPKSEGFWLNIRLARILYETFWFIDIQLYLIHEMNEISKKFNLFNSGYEIIGDFRRKVWMISMTYP